MTRAKPASLYELRLHLLKRAQHLVHGRAEAEDLVQEVLAKYVSAFKDEAPSERASMAWLATALKNAYISNLRRQLQLRSAPDPAFHEVPDRALATLTPAPHDLQTSSWVRPNTWPTVVTFYSAIVETDCSSIVSDVALHLAQRDVRVLVIDFDLQAPKVAELLGNSRSSGRGRSAPDLVELLRSLTTVRATPWARCLVPARPSTRSASEIHILSANPDQIEQVQGVDALDFDQMFERHDFGRRLEILRSDWLAAYDAVLINSPSGTSAVSGICVINLADVLIAALTLNRPNIEATKSACRRATTEHSKLQVDRRKLLTVPLLLESPSDGMGLAVALQHATSELGEFFADWLPGVVSPVEALRLLSPDDGFQGYERLASLLNNGWTLPPNPTMRPTARRRPPTIEPIEHREWAAPAAPGQSQFSVTITDEELAEAMSTLTAKQRQVFEASIRGLRHSEIARELGIKEGAVAKRIFDARRRVRAALLAIKSRQSTKQ